MSDPVEGQIKVDEDVSKEKKKRKKNKKSAEASVEAPEPEALATKSNQGIIEPSSSNLGPIIQSSQQTIKENGKDEIPLQDNSEFVRHWKRNFRQNYSYFSLFRFASRIDHIRLIVGVIAAIIGGLCLPLLILTFGNTIRTMVLVTKIKHAQNCSALKSTLGNATDCENFAMQCREIDKPFGRHSMNQTVLDKVTVETIGEFLLGHFLTTLAFTICSSIYFICWHTAADNQMLRIRKKYFEALLRKDMAWFDTQKDPDSINTIMHDTRRIFEGIGDSVPIAINLTTIFIISVIISFSHGWELTILSTFAVVFLIITSLLVSQSRASKLVAEHNALAIGNELAEEVLTNIRTVIFFEGQKRELIRYKKELNRDVKKVFRWIIADSVCVLLLWVINFAVWGIIFWYGIALAIVSHDCKQKSDYDNYDAGDVIIVILSMIFGAGNIYMVIPVVRAMIIAKNYGQRVFKIIDSPRGIDNLDTEGSVIEDFKGNIEFQDVRYTYPARKENVILNHLNLNIAAGSKAALVGINGCGKSTIIKLICKEYLPDSGFIKLDGQDIRDLNTKWLRNQIGVVPQEATLFDDTIEANVRMGKLDATFFEVQEACKKANAHNFVVSLKEAYQTRIGNRGCKLTAGQQQRLVIARALVRNPRILLLDEPTCSLDPESEILVMNTLDQVSRDRTVVVITHRLHTITQADQIFVIKRGKVAEKGVHANLVKNKGPYSQLASGLYDKPSTSIKTVPHIKYFDETTITAVHYMKLFGSKPLLPNLYNDLRSVNPDAIAAYSRLLADTSNSKSSFTASRGLTFAESMEQFFTLEIKDSIKVGDSELSKSEKDFKNNEDLRKDSNLDNPHEAGQLVRVSSDTGVEGFKDFFDPKQYSCWQITWLATNSSIKSLLIFSIVFSVCLGLSLPIFGILFSKVIVVLSDPTAVPGDWTDAKQLGKENYYDWIIAGFEILGLWAGVFAALQNFCLSLASYNMIKYVRKKLFATFLRQDLSFFENPMNGVVSLKNMLSNNVESLRYILWGLFSNIIETIVTVLMAIILAVCLYASDLAWYTVAIASGVAVINFIDSWLAKKQLMVSMKSLREISDLILQVFQGKNNVTTMQLEPFFIEKFNNIQKATLRKRRYISFIRAITFGLAQTSVFWGYTFLVYLQKIEIIDIGPNFSDVVAVGELLLFGLITVGTNLSVIPSFSVAVQAGKEILNVFSRKTDIPTDSGEELTDCKGGLGFHDAHFWYPYSGDNPLLKGVNYVIQPGQTVGIVGSSESGKSVYLDLIMRLYDVTSGAITLDGVDLRHINVLDLRNHIGYIEKQPQLFKRTVAENIAYGDNKNPVTMKEIVEAAKKTDMHNFICSLPDGYETRIGGEKDFLSTAQKQRITVARALMRDPKILLVDEATTSLDREGEKLVMESIAAARKGRTSIIIAHRLATVQKADLIIMMNDGYISEFGTHPELMKLNGQYAQLWRSQNPLEDDVFSKGKQKNAPPAPPPPPPPPPPKPKPEEPKPQPSISELKPPEEPKPEEKKGGWAVCSTLGT